MRLPLPGWRQRRAAERLAEHDRRVRLRDGLAEAIAEIEAKLVRDECDLCGWATGAEDYDEPNRSLVYPGVAWCPRCGFRLPDRRGA